MGSGENESAVVEMRPHQAGEALLRGGIKGAHRLVEKPDRPLHGQEPGDRALRVRS